MERNRMMGGRGGQRAGGSTTRVVGLMLVALCSVLRTRTTLEGIHAFGVSSHLCAKTRTNTNAFPSTVQLLQHTTIAVAARPITRVSLFNNDSDDDDDDDGLYSDNDATVPSSVWSPSIRKIIGGVASLGAVETGYLTYAKLANQATPAIFCGSSSQSAAVAVSSCDQVLNGPYSNLPFLQSVPLASLGFVAYSSVVGLALWPLVVSGSENETNEKTIVDDTQNRILLTALTTAMGTFSIFLMTLLFGVLRASCPYCVFSAADSFMLANLALIGGSLPEGTLEENGIEKRDTTGGKTVAVGFAGALISAVLLFGTGSIDAINTGGGSSSSSTLLATTISSGNPQQQEILLYAPPEITTESSEQALRVAKSLQQMDAKMYGAHWCSHCYDQKQALGKQAFSKHKPMVEYVECAKDGINSGFKTCKAKEIPGYPTWEINDKLYPGEQSVDELEELIKDIQSKKD